MQIKEAYDTLSVAEDISDEDLKKKYKELAKKHHPDVSKDNDTFKKINEAYQLINDYRTNPNKYAPQISEDFFGGMGGINFSDIFFSNGFYQQASNSQARFDTNPIDIVINLSFADSVLGCDREIKYQRQIKCGICNGNAFKHLPNECTTCDGFGRIINKQRGFITQSSCNKCYGRNTKKNKCDKCGARGRLSDDVSGTIAIPPGSTAGSLLRLGGRGNYVGTFIAEQYSDVIIHLDVAPDPTMRLNGTNVHSKSTISLQEALQGTKQTIKTVYGDKEIEIKPLSKNAQTITIPNCGVKNTSGSHIVELDVEYPKDVSKLIEVLNAVPDPV